MAFNKACNIDDVPQNGVLRCKVAGKPVAVYRLDDGCYATATRCPHAMGPLHRGKVTAEGRVVCPLHRAEFDIKTGKAEVWAVFPPGIAQLINLFRKKQDIDTYPVKVEGDEVLVDV